MPKRDWLIELRGQKTQEEVANDAGISRCYLSQLENGDRTPSPPIAQRLALVLGFDWGKFFHQEIVGAAAKTRRS